jgi:hypothetical protein
VGEGEGGDVGEGFGVGVEEGGKLVAARSGCVATRDVLVVVGATGIAWTMRMEQPARLPLRSIRLMKVMKKAKRVLPWFSVWCFDMEV